MTIPSARVAIITRTKDRPALLPRAIEGVLNQRYSDYIHVIVNDVGNVEKLEAVIAPYRARYGDKLLVIHRESSTGMESASNAGISACDSRYILIHDDDDSIHPDFLSRMVEFLETPYPIDNLGGVICHSTAVYESVEANGTVKEHSRNPFNPWVTDVTLWRMAAGNFFPPISFLFKREALTHIGAFEESLPVLGDWEFNMRMLQHYEIGVLRSNLSFYHHRVQDSRADSVYANSIIGGVDRHAFYHAYLKNKMLREDLQNNQLGLGLLVNMTPPVERLHAMTYRAEDMARPFLRLLRLPNRFVSKIRSWVK